MARALKALTSWWLSKSDLVLPSWRPWRSKLGEGQFWDDSYFALKGRRWSTWAAETLGSQPRFSGKNNGRHWAWQGTHPFLPWISCCIQPLAKLGAHHHDHDDVTAKSPVLITLHPPSYIVTPACGVLSGLTQSVPWSPWEAETLGSRPRLSGESNGRHWAWQSSVADPVAWHPFLPWISCGIQPLAKLGCWERHHHDHDDVFKPPSCSRWWATNEQKKKPANKNKTTERWRKEDSESLGWKTLKEYSLGSDMGGKILAKRVRVASQSPLGWDAT